jgi:hypothetical protein|tara:strand:+ start:12362 stop:12709 length:348 start_codon:yes stop_codon:yes gene_type:complete
MSIPNNPRYTADRVLAAGGRPGAFAHWQPAIQKANQNFALHVPQQRQLVFHLGQFQKRLPLIGFGLVPLIGKADNCSRVYSVHAAIASSEILYAVTPCPNRSFPHGISTCFLTRA